MRTESITLPDGSPLCEAAEKSDGGFRDFCPIKTGVAAQRKLVEMVTEMAFWGTDARDYRAWQETARRCVEALAARLNVSQGSLFRVAIKKTEAKFRREGWIIQGDITQHASPRP